MFLQLVPINIYVFTTYFFTYLMSGEFETKHDYLRGAW